MNELSIIKISDEIQEALKDKKPVVALESTLISHGLPSPLNIDVALKAESILRDLQVVPATAALIDGYLRVGLNPEEIELLGSSNEVTKTSFNNLGEVIANKTLGATTGHLPCLLLINQVSKFLQLVVLGEFIGGLMPISPLI